MRDVVQVSADVDVHHPVDDLLHRTTDMPNGLVLIALGSESIGIFLEHLLNLRCKCLFSDYFHDVYRTCTG
ncbi:hypothetical protein [Paenibacillus terreus]|uniref:hypothetical protein n=1 Tax=Paenibacillus terreus TaxID=1387834 RepID=UPI0035CD24ED